MNQHLGRQVEEIADTTDGDTCRVIVQMAPPADVAKYINATSRAVAEQRQAITARSLVPPRASALGDGRRSSLSTRGGNAALSAQLFMASRYLGSWAREQITRTGKASLEPLTRSDIYRNFGNGRPPSEFPLAAAAAISVSKSALKTLARDVTGVAALFPSRFIRVPPVRTAGDHLPAAVADNKGHAWGVSRTGALGVWGAYGCRGSGVKVAVLDTGYDNHHPDLKGKLANFAEFDENGHLVPGSDNVAAAYDDGTHGTHVAGTIVGGSASGRWIGMAPEARILAGLVLKNGRGTSEQILAGMQWAVDQDADVINMSLGGLDMSPDVFDTYTLAVLNASRLGIPVVAAIGNEGAGTSGAPGNDLFAFTVGATDVDDRAAGFSGGRTQIIRQSRYIGHEFLPLPFTKPELTAPGVDVYSAVPGAKWDTYSGSSMATPHVSGAMALLLGKPPRGTTTLRNLPGRQRVDVLQQLLTSTVKELGEAGQDHRFGYGRLDVLRAFGYAVDLGYLPKPR